MTDEDKDWRYPLDAALLKVPKTRSCIAHELRMMAKGAGEYRRFTYISPWTKNIWRAAAELLDQQEHNQLH